MIKTTADLSLLLSKKETSKVQLGRLEMFDGTVCKWATDGEEYLLTKIRNDKQNSFLWDRLGNLYHKGNRPDLAVVAFEKSLQIDPLQTESHLSLAQILKYTDDHESAIHHAREVLKTANLYNRLEPKNLRDMLTECLLILFDNCSDTESFLSSLPTGQEIIGNKAGERQEKKLTQTMDFEIFPDDPTSFYPLAEMYMRKQAKQLSVSERTLDRISKHNLEKKNRQKQNQQKKKAKNKRRMKKKSKK